MNLTKSLDPDKATKKQIKDWQQLTAMRHRIEAELESIKSLNLTYREIEVAFGQLLEVLKRYASGDDYTQPLSRYRRQ